jgi:hypothetical protein
VSPVTENVLRPFKPQARCRPFPPVEIGSPLEPLILPEAPDEATWGVAGLRHGLELTPPIRRAPPLLRPSSSDAFPLLCRTLIPCGGWTPGRVRRRLGVRVNPNRERTVFGHREGKGACRTYNASAGALPRKHCRPFKKGDIS